MVAHPDIRERVAPTRGILDDVLEQQRRRLHVADQEVFGVPHHPKNVCEVLLLPFAAHRGGVGDTGAFVHDRGEIAKSHF